MIVTFQLVTFEGYYEVKVLPGIHGLKDITFPLSSIYGSITWSVICQSFQVLLGSRKGFVHGGSCALSLMLRHQTRPVLLLVSVSYPTGNSVTRVQEPCCLNLQSPSRRFLQLPLSFSLCLSARLAHTHAHTPTQCTINHLNCESSFKIRE